MHIHPQNVPTCGASDRCLVHYESSANMEQGVRKDPTFTTRFGSSYSQHFDIGQSLAVVGSGALSRRLNLAPNRVVLRPELPVVSFDDRT
jgi:hypothetical protein